MSATGGLSRQMLDGKYLIEQLLGEGGMGSVYKAMHVGTKRTVAVKVIHSAFSANPEFIARFRREAEAAGRLRHPNVVDVTDFGFATTQSGPVAYLVMEYLDGCSLAEVLDEEKRLPVAWVVDIIEQAGSAIDEAHRHGIVHRDLKPENIWLEPNRRGGFTVKVLDFGLVKLGASQSETEAAETEALAASSRSAERPGLASTTSPAAGAQTIQFHAEETLTEATTLIEPADKREPPIQGKRFGHKSLQADNIATLELPIQKRESVPPVEAGNSPGLTRAGSIMGTPAYMSPEQFGGESVDSRSDIYSLGAVAYRMLTGSTPFNGQLQELIRQHEEEAPPSIRELNARVPGSVARVVSSALAKNPANRPQTAGGFASALRAGAEGSGTLLRAAFALYSERFPTFLKISLVGFTPLIVVILLFSLLDKFPGFNPSSNPSISGAVFGFTIILTNLAANILAYAIVAAVTVPIVVQFMIAPLREPQITAAIATLKRRWVVFSAATLVFLLLVLGGTILFLIPGLVALVSFALYAPVAVMEQLGVWATLKRARTLMTRSRLTVLVIALLQFALPVLVWIVSAHVDIHFKFGNDWQPKEFGINFNLSVRSTLLQLLNILITPLSSIMAAMLYLKTRQAGGETLTDIFDQVYRGDMPRSRWQARMRGRFSG